MKTIPRELGFVYTPDPDPAKAYPCARCQSTTKVRYLMKIYNEDLVVCRDCAKQVRKDRKAQRQRIPKQRRTNVSPEHLAERLQNLNKANLALRAREEAIKHGMLPQISLRYLQIAFCALSGMTETSIQHMFGYKLRETITKILRRPEVKAEMEKIIAAQRQKLINGEFGVQAMMKAKAVAMAQTIADQATYASEGVKHREALKAAELGLKLSGDFVKKTVHEHLFGLIKGFTDEELETYRTHKRWPARFADSLRALGVIDVTPNGSG